MDSLKSETCPDLHQTEPTVFMDQPQKVPLTLAKHWESGPKAFMDYLKSQTNSNLHLKDTLVFMAAHIRFYIWRGWAS